MDLTDAYAEACRQLGHQHVRLSAMAAELVRVEAERDEAGARVAELVAQQQPAPDVPEDCCPRPTDAQADTPAAARTGTTPTA